jgi:type I restriction enzyme S subunit
MRSSRRALEAARTRDGGETESRTSLRTFKSYPVYKESGVEWLGSIPAHWNERRLRSTVALCQNGLWGDEPDGKNDVPCVRVADFDRVALRVRMVEPTLRAIDSSVIQARRLRAGDLLIEKSGGGERQPVGVVVLYDHETLAVCSNFIARIPVANGFSPRFVTYLHAALYASRINTRSIKQSTGIQNLDSSGYLSEAVAYPELNQQLAIARFLDQETTRIDALVEKKWQLLALLQEQRTGMIHRAVTKGLDPNVAIKDSGVGWLGDIPEHWVVERIKWAARMESGHTPDKQVEAYWFGGDIPWVSLADTGQLREIDYISRTAVSTTSEGIAHSSARILPPGTVLFSRDATVGLCAITRGSLAVSQHFIGWVCSSRLQPEYLLFVLRSMSQELERLTMGATVRTIGMSDVRWLAIPIPPLIEQELIVNHVRDQRKQIDALIAKVREAIDRLKELRTALISAAVTGKIDVRDEVA